MWWGKGRHVPFCVKTCLSETPATPKISGVVLSPRAEFHLVWQDMIKLRLMCWIFFAVRPLLLSDKAYAPLLWRYYFFSFSNLLLAKSYTCLFLHMIHLIERPQAPEQLSRLLCLKPVNSCQLIACSHRCNRSPLPVRLYKQAPNTTMP